MYKYVGEFKNNEFDGEGTAYYVGGETESGKWKKGEFIGKVSGSLKDNTSLAEKPIGNKEEKTPQVETVSARELKLYNVQVAAFSILNNAIGLRGQLREKGYDAKIYFDEPIRMYRVVSASFSNLQDAINSKNNMESNYPNYNSCYIFTIQNGQTTFLK
jgi:hypothetical protein